MFILTFLFMHSLKSASKQRGINMNKRNLRIDEFSEIYGICRTKVYQEIKEGRLKTFKCGKVTLISKEAAEKWQSTLEQGGRNE